MPSPGSSSAGHREGGTASIELVGAVPILLLAALVAAQLGLAGGALWSAGVAARAGARAALVGGDAVPAARRALPTALRSGARVGASDGIAVRVEVPRLLPLLPRLTVAARARID